MEITNVRIIKNDKEGYCLVKLVEGQEPQVAYKEVINADDHWQEMPIEQAEALVRQWELEHPIEEI